MSHSSILDLGGNTSSGTISKSHLGSGSPKLSADAYHPKRAKHYSEHSKHKIAQLRNKIKSDVTSLLGSRKLERLYALIYRDVELLCIAKHSEQALLSEFIFNEIDKTLSLEIVPQITDCLLKFAGEYAESTTERFLQIYNDWDNALRLLLQLFLYLDRSYLFHHPRNSCIREYGIKRFMEKLLIHAVSDDEREKANDPMCALVSLLIEKMENDRSNSVLCGLTEKLIVTLSLMDPENSLNINSSLASIFVDVYTKLQRKWLKDKRTYVSVLIRNLVADHNLLCEAKKSSEFIDKLNAVLAWKLLLSDLNFYFEPALPYLTLPENFEILLFVTHICEKSMKAYGVDSIKMLVTIWGRYIQGKAKSALLDSEVIPCILKLWKDLHKICEDAFINEAFDFEVRSALQRTLGQSDLAPTVVFHLSKYCDSAMKQANMSSLVFSELEADVLTVFKLITDKRAFLSIYEKDLSKRILMAKNFSFDFEKKLIDSIVSIIGESDENFKLRAMLRDYSKSRSSFSHLTLPFAPQTNFSALVLEKKVWPDIPGFGSDVQLPETLLGTLAEFERYFNGMDEKKHKVLDWKSYTLHQLTLTTQFASECKDLQVNLLQATVLMLFEDVDTLNFSQILNSTQMGEKLLKRVLSSLSTEKYPILNIDSDTVTFNHNFNDRAHKIKLPMGKERDAAVAESVKRLVDEGRSSETRSVLVKIMKSHKSLLFTELLGKTIEALTPRGTPQIQDIKNEIEHLILTDYIARDATGTTLNYIP